MKKLSNKGFMMAEVIVVSAVIMTTLVALYTSYNKIFSIYNQRVRYYDIDTLYELAFIRDNSLYDVTDSGVILSDENIKDIEGIDDISDMKYTRTLLFEHGDYIKEIDTSKINKTYKEYIEYLSDSINLDRTYNISEEDKDKMYWDEGKKYILIMERCKVDDNNDCTYAYLEEFFLKL